MFMLKYCALYPVIELHAVVPISFGIDFEPVGLFSPTAGHRSWSLVVFSAHQCVCYREIKDMEDTLKLQKDIDRLGIWARKWGMRLFI